jgi:hypothetical protein
MEIFLDQKFLIPFLSTAGASLTIIFLRFLSRYISNRKKKLYAVAYIADISSRMLFSDLMLKKSTILPHISAVKKIITGDTNLSQTMFLADEFDVLTDPPFDFNFLAEEYMVLLGNDDIDLVQVYEVINYTNKNNTTQKAFNEFVRNNLKSQHLFSQKTREAQRDILATYWDYLDKLNNEGDRNIRFVIDEIAPRMKNYSNGKQFLFFSKKSVRKSLMKIERAISYFKDVLPEKKTPESIMSGGIQRAL